MEDIQQTYFKMMEQDDVICKEIEELEKQMNAIKNKLQPLKKQSKQLQRKIVDIVKKEIVNLINKDLNMKVDSLTVTRPTCVYVGATDSDNEPISFNLSLGRCDGGDIMSREVCIKQINKHSYELKRLSVGQRVLHEI